MSLDVYLTYEGGEQDGERVFEGNITHNLAKMAKECGLYEPLWHPPAECRARDLIEALRDGLAKLTSDPLRFEQFNPTNGWGDFDGLVRFATDYYMGCVRHPNASVTAYG